MSRTISIMILALQIALTFIATFCIYMVFALLDSDFGFDGFFGLIIIQPVIAIILSGVTILVCFIVGIPIRYNKKLNHWWTTNFFIPVIGTICGLTILILALLPAFAEIITTEIDGQQIIKQIPNSLLLISGWFLTAFSLMHTYPPQLLTEKVKGIFSNLFNVFLIVIASCIMTACNNANTTIERPALLKADREAQLGWVYLTIYEDSTFEFSLTGIRSADDVYKGKVMIRKDSLFFSYADSIPKAGKTAIFNDKVVRYIEGEYPEQVNISMTKLSK